MDQAYALMRATRRPKINDVNQTQYICEANYIRYIW